MNLLDRFQNCVPYNVNQSFKNDELMFIKEEENAQKESKRMLRSFVEDKMTNSI